MPQVAYSIQHTTCSSQPVACDRKMQANQYASLHVSLCKEYAPRDVGPVMCQAQAVPLPFSVTPAASVVDPTMRDPVHCIITDSREQMHSALFCLAYGLHTCSSLCLHVSLPHLKQLLLLCFNMHVLSVFADMKNSKNSCITVSDDQAKQLLLQQQKQL